MTQEDSLPSVPPKPQSHTNDDPFFSVTGRVHFKPMMAGPEREAGPLPPVVTRLVSLVSLLGVVLLGPLSGCGSLGDTPAVPCPVPTSTPVGTPGPARTPVTCTTSSGTHYLWLPTRGGWVQSDDGLHPNPNAHGVGANEGHGGVGDGHGGAGHGGSHGG